MIGDGDERTIADSGYDWMKGTMKFGLLKPPLLDSFIPDNQIGMALLPSNSMDVGDIPNGYTGDVVLNQ
jgi:hypothetical protein